jgi:hypothetical protein
MTNERLRRAMAAAHVGVEEVSQATRVDPKTVQRWIKGRVPHARHRWAVAELVHEDERYLWPDAEGERTPGSPTTAEVVAAYPHRADVPPERWWTLMVDARRQVDLLAYAMLFLPETHPRLFELLRGKAAAGCQIRIALVDPASRISWSETPRNASMAAWSPEYELRCTTFRRAWRIVRASS